jgi:hypothetical protein
MTTVYTKRFIFYNESGKILEIRPYTPVDNTLYLEIDYSLVEDFLFGGKSYENYTINYFLNLKNGIVNEDEIIDTDKKFLYSLSKTLSYKNEITLEHCLDSWNLIIRDDVKEKVKLFSKLDFYICKKDEPSFLYSKISFNLSSIQPIKFNSIKEQDLNLISVIVSKKFNSYGIKEIYE